MILLDQSLGHYIKISNELNEVLDQDLHITANVILALSAVTIAHRALKAFIKLQLALCSQLLRHLSTDFAVIVLGPL